MTTTGTMSADHARDASAASIGAIAAATRTARKSPVSVSTGGILPGARGLRQSSDDAPPLVI